jgi:xylan 1,4-beta-xylosidase
MQSIAHPLRRPALLRALPPHEQGGGTAYGNPVIRGFAPDPSVVRVGDDYYVVHSTFQFFPAISISHSRDLVHWRRIGHVFESVESLDLRSYFDGCGVWAPDISYHDGWFYVFFCLVQLTRDRTVNRRGNYMVRSRSIHGPWSEPVQLTDEGNDPSHFVEDDGSHWMLYAPGMRLERGTKIVRLSDDCTRTVGEPYWMRWGSDRTAPEGPHVFKRGGWYYHTMAAGSGIYDGHHQLIARSRTLLGEYEPSPHGPFIAQLDRSSPIQHHGHAKLVEDTTGRWWAMYLCQRRLNGVSPLGRETGLDRIDWLDDGWPVISGGCGPISHTNGFVRSHAAEVIDDFDAPKLDVDWMSIRKPAEFSLAARPGWLRLQADRSPLSESSCSGALLRRETNHYYVARTLVDFDSSHGGLAGLVCYYDTACHISLSVTGRNERVLELAERRRGVDAIVARVAVPDGKLHLGVQVEGLRRTFSFSVDGERWLDIASIEDCSFLSDEGTPNWGFTGTLVGVFATSDGGQRAAHADFDWFAMRDEV